MRRRSRAALLGALLAVIASAPAEEEAYEVFTSQPGPFFSISDNRTIVDWLVTVRASPEAFPPEGDWRETFEVELDVRQDGPRFGDLRLFGRLARVAPNQRRVLSSTVASVDVEDVGTLILTDRQGYSPCIEGVCQKRYVVRFVLLGFGFLETQWFLRAGIDWATEDLEVPADAELTMTIQRL